jgi:hypothetical protein
MSWQLWFTAYAYSTICRVSRVLIHYLCAYARRFTRLTLRMFVATDVDDLIYLAKPIILSQSGEAIGV